MYSCAELCASMMKTDVFLFESYKQKGKENIQETREEKELFDFPTKEICMIVKLRKI